MKAHAQFSATLVLMSALVSSALADVSIPDPGLNAAVREALQKPTGPLTEQDLLSLTDLDAHRRGIHDLEGLEAARNLVSLNLESNLLTSFSLPFTLTNLVVLNLSLNLITNCSLEPGPTNLTSIIIEGNPLAEFALPATFTGLTNLDLDNNQLDTFDVPASLTSLVSLDLGFNRITNFSLPGGLTNLSTLIFAANYLTNIALPSGLTRLSQLDLAENFLTTLALPEDMTNLLTLDLFFNQLTNLTLPGELRSLTSLDLDYNRFSDFRLPASLTQLAEFHVRSNLLTTIEIPTGLSALASLDVGENPLTNLTLPAGLGRLSVLRVANTRLTSLALPPGLTNLSLVFLRNNQLTNLTLPSDLSRLATLDVLHNQLASLALPPGLISLTNLFLSGNQLTSLTLPPDVANLVSLVLEGNPLTTLVLSDPLAGGNLSEAVIALRNQGVSVFTYPLVAQLLRPHVLTGAFQFGVTGPPGVYTVLGSDDLTAWSPIGFATNQLGSVSFVDTTAHVSPHRFYRVAARTSPRNMVFIAPNTFIMGSPTNELHRQPNEGPQTTVRLTRGFWIGKYEVTQGEYLEVTLTNPSIFPGDLSRPVSSVSWPDATNYCWLLTQRELVAGRIPPGSRYRLPTEAEWECAARAGTNTRFSYGDDPDYTSLTNHAWYFLNSGLTVHPVGQKLPNPWGLYDMEGNVWEWTQDWLGDLPGGAVTDPTGPVSNAIGLKVVRGGSYDFSEPQCRSANRFFFGSHPALNDSDIGFRVVLVTGP